MGQRDGAQSSISPQANDKSCKQRQPIQSEIPAQQLLPALPLVSEVPRTESGASGPAPPSQARRVEECRVHDGRVTYRERRTAVAGAVLWEREVQPGFERARILPDGCLDLLWDGRRLFVAGPDSTARWHESRPGTRYVALRFAGGTGPALLGVPADELRDQTLDLEDLLPPGEVLALAERVATDPSDSLEAWAVERAAAWQVDPLGPRVLAMATAGLAVAMMGEQLGISARQLHRRCLPIFGYGPRRLSRIVRMGQALDAARTRPSLAQVAAESGYVDQPHFCRETRELAGTTPTLLLRELGLR